MEKWFIQELKVMTGYKGSLFWETLFVMKFKIFIYYTKFKGKKMKLIVQKKSKV